MTTTGRPRLDEIGLSPGKQTRLHHSLHEHGLRNGTALVLLEKARMSMEAGATGLIFGRNVRQRRHDQSLRFVERLRAIRAGYSDGTT